MSKKLTKLIVLTLVMIYSICFTTNAKETTTSNDTVSEKAFVNIDVDGDIRILDGVFMNEEARKTLDAVNALRAEKGLEPLVWANDFDLLGKLRAAEIQEVYSHSRPNGEPRIIIKDSKIILTGENIAMGYQNAEEVMKGWTKSPGHYANMTDVDYQSYYCACFVTYDAEYGWAWYTWVQLFSFDKLDGDETESNVKVPGNNTITIQTTEDTGNSTAEKNPEVTVTIVEEPIVLPPAPINTIIYEPIALPSEPTNTIIYEPIVLPPEPTNTIIYEPIVLPPEPTNTIIYEPIVLPPEPTNTIIYEPIVLPPEPTNTIIYESIVEY